VTAGLADSLLSLLPERLRRLGLRKVREVRTHTNRTVMVSLGADRVLRLHQGYAFAPDRVLRAIVRFVDPSDSRMPGQSVRRLAERELLSFPVELYAPAPACVRRPDSPEPGDLRLLHKLRQLHGELNQRHFGSRLSEVPIRLSGRMRTRLGELSVDLRSGRPIEIALSRRHLKRHPWHEVEHTVLHEMVHQWQAETGLPVNHGPTFRRKAREVGVMPSPSRALGPPGKVACITDPRRNRG
jgi:hypothetical protein